MKLITNGPIKLLIQWLLLCAHLRHALDTFLWFLIASMFIETINLQATSSSFSSYSDSGFDFSSSSLDKIAKKDDQTDWSEAISNKDKQDHVEGEAFDCQWQRRRSTETATCAPSSIVENGGLHFFLWLWLWLDINALLLWIWLLIHCIRSFNEGY